MSAHCESEALRLLPQQLVTHQVVRTVHVGQRTVGTRTTCKTELSESKDRKGTWVQTRETVCRDEPVTEPVYEPRLVSETVDANLVLRQNHVRTCSADAMARGLFSHLK